MAFTTQGDFIGNAALNQTMHDSLSPEVYQKYQKSYHFTVALQLIPIISFFLYLIFALTHRFVHDHFDMSIIVIGIILLVFLIVGIPVSCCIKPTWFYIRASIEFRKISNHIDYDDFVYKMEYFDCDSLEERTLRKKHFIGIWISLIVCIFTIALLSFISYKL